MMQLFALIFCFVSISTKAKLETIPMKKIESLHEYNKIIIDSASFFLIMDGPNDPLEEIISNSSQAFVPLIIFYYSYSKELIDHFQVKNGHQFFVLKLFDEGIVEFEKEFTKENIRDFIFTHYLPRQAFYDAMQEQRILNTNLNVLLLIYGEDQTKNENHLAYFKKVKLPPNMLQMVVTQDSQISLLKIFNIEPRQDIQIMILEQNSGNYRKYLFDIEIEYFSLIGFIEDYEKGLLKPHYLVFYQFQSQKIVEQNDKFIHLSLNNFDTILANQDLNAFIAFHREDDLQQSYEELERLAELFEGKVLIATVNCSLNDCNFWEIYQSPKFYFYDKKEDSFTFEYLDDIDYEKMSDFIEQFDKQYFKFRSNTQEQVDQFQQQEL